MNCVHCMVTRWHWLNASKYAKHTCTQAANALIMIAHIIYIYTYTLIVNRQVTKCTGVPFMLNTKDLKHWTFTFPRSCALTYTHTHSLWTLHDAVTYFIFLRLFCYLLEATTSLWQQNVQIWDNLIYVSTCWCTVCVCLCANDWQCPTC